jgi:hypothetical protein
VSSIVPGPFFLLHLMVLNTFKRLAALPVCQPT